jgi:hypothetical protein
MTLAEFVADVVKALEAASIDYMIGGSVASSIYGEPRTTRDIDIVVEVTANSLNVLFGPLNRSRFYVDEPPSGVALTPGQMFNILDSNGGWKADLVVRKEREFSVVEFGRRAPRDVMGTSAMVASAEDVLLSKLEWSLKSGSSRQLDDARGIAVVQGDRLDLQYLRRWAARLAVDELLSDVLSSTS